MLWLRLDVENLVGFDWFRTGAEHTTRPFIDSYLLNIKLLHDSIVSACSIEALDTKPRISDTFCDVMNWVTSSLYQSLHVRSDSTDCGSKLTGSQGSFTSPNYPGDYPTDVTCVWIIEAKTSEVIVLSFESLDIEYSKKCKYDSLEILDGSSVRIQSLLGCFILLKN